MRIWLVDPASNLPFYTVSLADALAEAGHQVKLITSPFIYDDTLPKPNTATLDYHFFRFLNDKNKSQFTTQPVLWKFRRGLAYPAALLRLLWRIWHERPDVVHIQWVPMLFLDRLFMQAAKRSGALIIYTIHNILPHDPPDLQRAMRRFGSLYGIADGLVVHAQQNCDELLKLFPYLHVDKVHIIPLGPPFADRYPVRDRAVHRQNLQLTGPTLLFFGNDRPYKGLKDLLEALPSILESVPKAQLLIAGKRTPLLDQHLKFITANGLAEHAKIIPDFVPSAEIQNYYGAVDVAALPYNKIYQSANLLTAMAFALPVVAYRVGGLPEVIEAANCGILVDPGDTVGFAAACAGLLSDTSRAAQLGLNGRQFVEETMNWTQIAAKTTAMYCTAKQQQPPVHFRPH